MDCVIAPTGGFGNHVRWLLLLSDKYTFFNCINIKDKVNFIKENVYNENRSWHNWLTFEFTYRDELHETINFTHDLKTIYEDKFTDSKFILLTIDGNLAYKCYFKFNSYLNTLSLNDFMLMINKHNKMTNIANKKDNRIFTAKSDNLFNEKLDKNIYTSMIHWFNLEDRYDYATEIHSIWYNLHRKSEKKFVSDITKLYIDQENI